MGKVEGMGVGRSNGKGRIDGARQWRSVGTGPCRHTHL